MHIHQTRTPYREKAQAAMTANPALRLLRSSHALFTLSFLHKVFKETWAPAHPADLVAVRLDEFIADWPYEGRAETWLDLWCRDEVRVLRRFSDEDGTVMVELTPSTERVFQWIDDLAEGGMVGAESRFLEIQRRLEELVENTTDDPEVRLKMLENRRMRLDREIEALKTGRSLPVYSDQQIRERMGALIRHSRDLLGDFKQVEENFKAIVKEIYSRQSQDFSRGEILGYTLDATEEMRNSPQGRSFYTFWDFLIRDTGEETLRSQVDELSRRLEHRGLELSDDFLRHLKSYLHEAGKKVLAGNRLLAEKLNKLLSDQERKSREKTGELIRAIKDGTLRLKGVVDWEEFIQVDGVPEVTMLMERPLGEPPRQSAWSRPQLAPSQPDRDLWTELAGRVTVNPETLSQRLAEALERKHEVTLAELFERPPELGLEEVLGYLTLGFPSRWDREESLEIPLDAAGERKLLMPKLTFGRTGNE